MGATQRTMEDLAAMVAAGKTFPYREKKADDTPEKIAKYKAMIGQKVTKTSRSNNKTTPKPFKSGNRVNTVKAADFIHPVSGNLCFTFEEDNSYLQCYQCRLADDVTK